MQGQEQEQAGATPGAGAGAGAGAGVQEQEQEQEQEEQEQEQEQEQVQAQVQEQVQEQEQPQARAEFHFVGSRRSRWPCPTFAGLGVTVPSLKLSFYPFLPFLLTLYGLTELSRCQGARRSQFLSNITHRTGSFTGRARCMRGHRLADGDSLVRARRVCEESEAKGWDSVCCCLSSSVSFSGEARPCSSSTRLRASTMSFFKDFMVSSVCPLLASSFNKLSFLRRFKSVGRPAARTIFSKSLELRLYSGEHFSGLIASSGLLRLFFFASSPTSLRGPVRIEAPED